MTFFFDSIQLSSNSLQVDEFKTQRFVRNEDETNRAANVFVIIFNFEVLQNLPARNPSIKNLQLVETRAGQVISDLDMINTIL